MKKLIFLLIAVILFAGVDVCAEQTGTQQEQKSDGEEAVVDIKAQEMGKEAEKVRKLNIFIGILAAIILVLIVLIKLLKPKENEKKWDWMSF